MYYLELNLKNNDFQTDLAKFNKLVAFLPALLVGFVETAFMKYLKTLYTTTKAAILNKLTLLADNRTDKLTSNTILLGTDFYLRSQKLSTAGYDEHGSSSYPNFSA